jgi:hypothetical protein
LFKDCAIIQKIEEDLVSLQLSRDVLPVDLELEYGQILELRSGSDGNGYCCRSMVVSEGDASTLLLRLVGEIVSDELREFYRIDAFLPIKYFVSHVQNIDQLHKEWEIRRVNRQRQQLKAGDNTYRWPGGLLPSGTGVHNERHHNSSAEGNNSVEARDSWEGVAPLAANISGGGLRFITHQGFEQGEYTLLEIMVPSPPRTIDVVGRVAFSNRNFAAGSDREFFNTGVQYVYIDDQDRDAIVYYITTIQLKRIQQLREQYLDRGTFGSAMQSGNTGMFSRKSAVNTVILVVIAVIVTLLLVELYRRYSAEQPKGEIQRMFEESIKKYQMRM